MERPAEKFEGYILRYLISVHVADVFEARSVELGGISSVKLKGEQILPLAALAPLNHATYSPAAP